VASSGRVEDEGIEDTSEDAGFDEPEPEPMLEIDLAEESNPVAVEPDVEEEAIPDIIPDVEEEDFDIDLSLGTDLLTGFEDISDDEMTDDDFGIFNDEE